MKPLQLPLLPRPRVLLVDGIPVLTSRRNGVSFGNERP